jgi:hypothetical protein
MQDAAQHNPNISDKTTNTKTNNIKEKTKPSLNKPCHTGNQHKKNHVTLATNTKNILNHTN